MVQALIASAYDDAPAVEKALADYGIALQEAEAEVTEARKAHDAACSWRDGIAQVHARKVKIARLEAELAVLKSKDV